MQDKRSVYPVNPCRRNRCARRELAPRFRSILLCLRGVLVAGPVLHLTPFEVGAKLVCQPLAATWRGLCCPSRLMLLPHVREPTPATRACEMAPLLGANLPLWQGPAL